VFRKVGIKNSDAGESPKRKNTTKSLIVNCSHLIKQQKFLFPDIHSYEIFLRCYVKPSLLKNAQAFLDTFCV